MIGKTLAHYEILDLLGTGGMGEVYRARDQNLGREVALKVLPTDLAQDAERLARFRREARTLASLQHPNVATIYGLEEADDRLLLTMELAEGEDLSDRIARGPLRADDAVEIARRIARGLEEAHGKGIVHRDLKPSNVKIAPDGQVKILDFGLARAYSGEGVEEADLSNSPTITAAMTQAGTILGTAAYMSPEQARGKPVDHRADVWAFGVLLWEMLTGKRLFEGETTSDTLANVLKHDVDLDAIPPSTPPNVRRVLARCLVRDPRSRLHSVADARIELEQPDDGEDFIGAPGGTGAATGRLGWAVAGLLLVTSLALAWQPWRESPPESAGPLAVSVTLPDQTELALIDWSAVAVSRDGGMLALTAHVDGRTTVVGRPIGERFVRPLSGEGTAFHVFFSPDGKWVGYYSANRLMKVSAEGGVPVKIVETAHPRGASWGEDGFVYYSPEYSTGIFRVADSGNAQPEQLTTPDTDLEERTHRWPEVLPGSRGVVFTIGTAQSPGDYEDAEIAIYDIRQGEIRRLGIQGAIARYSPTGHLLVMRDGVLHAVRFDLGSLDATGTPEPVFDGIRGDSASGMYYFALDSEANLYYVAARESGPRRRLAWIDRQGNVEPLGLPPGKYRYPRVHPDGARVALVLGEGHGSNDDIYVLELDGLNLTRMTFDQSSMMPNWKSDGRELLYSSVLKGALRIREMGGAATTRDVPASRGILLPTSVGPDDRTLIVTRLGGRTLGDIWAYDSEDSNLSAAVLESPAAEWGACFSPDGKWLAYTSDEAGREEIYVQPYPPTGAKWQVSTDGGRSPRWSHDGSEIFFVLGDRFYHAPIETDPEIRLRRPEVLFEHRMDSSGVPLANYDVTADGQRFLIVEPDETSGTGTVDVLYGFADRLRGLP